MSFWEIWKAIIINSFKENEKNNVIEIWNRINLLEKELQNLQNSNSNEIIDEFWLKINKNDEIEIM